MMMINPDQAKTLAAFIASLPRPAGAQHWDAPGIFKALQDGRTRGDVFELAHAALYAAAEATNRTPAVIPLVGPHWTRGRELTSTGAVPGHKEPRCEVHDWERAHNCRACRSEALEATPQTRALVAMYVPPANVRQILAGVPVPDGRSAAAGEGGAS